MNKVFFYILYVLGTFLLLEVVVRICFPLPELENFNRINYQILDRKDDQSGYLRNINMIWKSSLDTNYEFEHRLNSYGYRDSKAWDMAKKDKARFLFIGDSFVEGMMSTQDKTIPIGFEQAAIGKGREIEAFNCGMMGIGLNEYIKFLKDAVPIFQPEEVMLVLYSNDAPFQRDYVPQTTLKPKTYSFWKLRILAIIEQLKKEDPIPFQFSPERRPFYKAVPDPSNPWTTNEASLAPQVTPKIANAMKKGDFNYFRTNWILEEEKFLKADVKLRSKLKFIKDFLNQYNTKLTVFYIPSRSQVSNFYYQFERQACLQKCPEFVDLTGGAYQRHARILAEDCKALNIPFKDFTALIRDYEQKGRRMYWNYDDHMRGNSYVLLGKEMYDFWASTNAQ